MPQMDAWVYWLIAVAVFGIIEAATPQFVTIWFAAGSAVALIFSLCGLPVVVQVIAFAISSVVLIAVTRPLYIKFVKSRQVATNADGLVGKTAIVTEDIDNDEGLGFVKVSGQVWSARTVDGSRLTKGVKVDILSIEGVKLMVKLHLED